MALTQSDSTKMANVVFYVSEHNKTHSNEKADKTAGTSAGVVICKICLVKKYFFREPYNGLPERASLSVVNVDD